MAGPQTYTAFLNNKRVACGPLAEVLGRLSDHAAGARGALVFDDENGELIKLNTSHEVDVALSATDVGPSPPARAEHLGVKLLRRHIEWLEAQPGGPSAAVRRLVDAARQSGIGKDRQAKEAAYRFISMVAGDLPGFEEACRALFAGDIARFDVAAANWPNDVRIYAGRLMQGAVEPAQPDGGSR